MNVTELYKQLDEESIIADLDTKRNQFITVCQNLTADINKASVVRNHNAFNGKELWFLGKRKWNRVGAVGTYKYIHIKHTESVDELFEYLHEQGYIVYAVENNVGNEVSLYDVRFPPKSTFIFGEEGNGLSLDIISRCDKVVTIPQYGSVRSINVACASAVVMFEYCKQNVK